MSHRMFVSALGLVSLLTYPSAARADDERTFVEIESTTEDVSIERVNVSARVSGTGGSATAEELETVCVIPCARTLDRHARYRVVADGRQSDDFVLPRGDKTTLQVTRGSVAATVFGTFGVASGSVAVATGGALVGASFLTRQDAPHVEPLRIAGAITLAAAAALITTGIVLLAGPGSMRVRTEDGKRLAFTANGVTF